MTRNDDLAAAEGVIAGIGIGSALYALAGIIALLARLL